MTGFDRQHDVWALIAGWLEREGGKYDWQNLFDSARCIVCGTYVMTNMDWHPRSTPERSNVFYGHWEKDCPKAMDYVAKGYAILAEKKAQQSRPETAR